MATASSDRDPVEVLAEEFAERYRRGERPALSEYVARYPELAEQIRDLFPALVEMEQLGTVDAPGDRSAGAPPRQLGEYRVLREIGRGGMGVVYEAVQEPLGRHVALKVLPLHGLFNPTQLERFRREARAAARLHHTNIVPVFGTGEDGGIHYYAMQFIQGQGLDKVLDDVRRLRGGPGQPPAAPDQTLSGFVARGLISGQFPGAGAGATSAAGAAPAPAEARERHQFTSLPEAQYFRSAARAGLQAAEALAYAHKQGVLHRDIKPSNLLLDTQGTVWVTDFGLAKSDDSDDLTNTGDLVGTLRYMAPERLEGRCDVRSEVYGLGATLYEMVALRPAFAATDRLTLLEQLRRGVPPEPCRCDAHVPRDLETIILKAMARDPVERYASAEVLAEDLRRFLADRPIRARRTSPAERAWRWCRRNPFVAGLLAAVAVLLVGIAAVSTFSAARLRIALTKTQVAEREARLREADALVGQAHGIRYSRRPGQRFEALDALKRASAIGHELGQPPEWFDPLRNEAIAALALPDVHVRQSWEGLPPGTLRAEISRDFELYARATKEGACSIRRVADDREVAALPELGEPEADAFGPGRRLLRYAESSGRWQLWDLSGPEPALRLDEKEPIWSCSFRPDGRLFAVKHRDDSLSVYETDTFARRYRLPPGALTDLDIALHPAEPLLACGSYWSPLLQVRDLRTGDVLVSLDLPWRGNGVVWSPDGHTLAVPGGSNRLVGLYAWDPAAPRLTLTRTLRAPGNGGTSACFNPAGDRVVTRGWSTDVGLLDVSTGRLIFSDPGLSTTGWQGLHFDATGTRLAACRVGTKEERIGLWSVADGREYHTLVLGKPSRQYHEWGLPAVHPDGRLAAQGCEDGLALFDLDSGQELAFVKVPQGVGGVTFDGAGRLLCTGFEGAYRWPVRPDGGRPGRLLLGPPERLLLPEGDRGIAAGRDGTVIAQAVYGAGGGWVLHPASPLPRHPEAEGCHWAGVSPDGRWVVFGVHAEPVNVYETATGQRAWQSVDQGHNYCRFSRDGRWLVTDNDGTRAYRVGTWEAGPRLGAGIPWDVSPDGRLVVVGTRSAVYRLVDLETGRELARLEDPERLFRPALFTPDGTRLVVNAPDGLRVWDLRRIRSELAKLGLDWDAPPYPDGPDAATPSAPLQLRVDLGPLGDDFTVGAGTLNQRAIALKAKNDFRGALDSLRQAVQIAPQDAFSHAHLAWVLLVGPPELRQPAEALRHAEQADALQPRHPWYTTTLAVAHFRAGRVDEALPVLEHNLAADGDGDRGVDGFFVAMCYARLGDRDKAERYYDRAVKWLESRKGLSPSDVVQMPMIRAEADAVLHKPAKP